MALFAENSAHAAQIQAGITGRNRGHKFEETLAYEIVNLDLSELNPQKNAPHLQNANPARAVIEYMLINEDFSVGDVSSCNAWWLGGLATSGIGDTLKGPDGKPITKCKSDVLVEFVLADGICIKRGISVKTCSKKNPTNDQMYFTTAKAFCQLLRNNGISVSEAAEMGMSMFCGDPGLRPLDRLTSEELALRLADPNRFFWEETPEESKNEWAYIFSKKQDEVTRLLFQKAYLDDPYPPDYLLHQTVKFNDFDNCPLALFTIDEIVALSREYRGYELKSYTVNKGTYKADPSRHLAPRFGFIQFQRGGQRQHPTQLQFNLKAGYFRHI